MRGCGLDSAGLGYCPRWAVVNMAIKLWLPYNCGQFTDVLVECQPLEKDSAECRWKGREHIRRVCGWGRNKAHCCYASLSGWGVLHMSPGFDGCDWFLAVQVLCFMYNLMFRNNLHVFSNISFVKLDTPCPCNNVNEEFCCLTIILALRAFS